MSRVEKNDWETLEQVYAFIGNSLLTPMTRTSDVGISPSFWEDFPVFDNEHTRSGREKLIAYAGQDFDDHSKKIEKCAVEFTKLFVGPPSPAAPPWETMNKGEGGKVGFGEATFTMKKKLSEAGLSLENENNQYEDHMGIELLYLSVLCGKCAQEELEISPEEIKDFINEHPLSWIEFFRARIDEAYPVGYFTGLLELTQGILEWNAEQAGH